MQIRYLYFFIALLFCGCSERHGQVCFCFDDDYVDEWYAERALFQKYDIHATFFITRPSQLSQAQIRKLKALERDGHEIACHGMHHQNALGYTDSADIYFQNEVLAASEQMKKIGFDVQSFAYPFGAHFAALDSLISKQFLHIRLATYNMENQPLDKIDRVFASHDSKPPHIQDAMGLDVNYHISPADFETAIKRCNEQGETLVCYNHRINESGEDYTVSAAYLETLFKLCQKHRVKSMRFKSL